MYAEDKSQGNATIHESHGAYELVLSPVILALLGYLLDRQLGTMPIFTGIAAVLGLTGAVIKLVVEYKAKMAEHEANAPWKTARETGEGASA